MRRMRTQNLLLLKILRRLLNRLQFFSLIFLPLTGQTSLYAAFAICGALIALTNGVFPAYMANQFERYGLGRVQGLLTTNFCFANVIAALTGSAIALAGTGWSLFTGGILCLLASAWLWRLRNTALLSVG